MVWGDLLKKGRGALGEVGASLREAWKDTVEECAQFAARAREVSQAVGGAAHAVVDEVRQTVADGADALSKALRKDNGDVQDKLGQPKPQ